MPADTARLFVALWPDPAVRAILCDHRDAWRWPPGAKPVADDTLHLTLHFIGAFARCRVAALETALAAIPAAPIRLHATGTAVWRGGIAVLCFGAEPNLLALHAPIGDVLRQFDVALDPRPFSAHVTLARRAQGGAAPEALPELEWQSPGFVLVESIPGPRARYEIVRAFDRDR
jgi:RNA 2',3'-cyclic 3'-phosphodiesterase